MATQVPKEKLAKFFRLFSPEYVIGTTYTISLAFFESVVFPCINRSKLRKCLLLCDRLGFQRATSEAIALRGATREYMVATVPADFRFHPKVWIMVGETKLALLVGSGNLTQSGFMDNLELFDVVELEVGESGQQIAIAAAKFLADIRGLWKAENRRTLLAIDTLAEMSDAITQFASELTEDRADRRRFITNFNGSFAERLRESVGTGASAYVAAPYFGGSIAGLTHLHTTLAPQRLQVFPAMQNAKVDVPVAAISDLPNTTAHALKLATNKPFAHLKLYGFEDSTGDSWLFTGSVNCTDAALRGRNVEAGLLRPVPKELLGTYFAVDSRRKVATEQHEDTEEDAISDWFTFWATDLGDVIELVAAPAHDTRIPLSDVTFEIQFGGMRVAYQREQAFDLGLTARLPWKLFPEGRRSAHAARIIEIHGTDLQGRPVRGVAFVDDLVALTSEPTHRGAWRAALTLLSAEGLTEYSDVSALFHLVEDIAADEDEDQEEHSSQSWGSPAGSTKHVIKAKAPVWPPQPIEADVSSLATGHGTGDIYWFNRILASLVQRTDAHQVAGDKSVSVDDEENEDKEPEAPPPRVIHACQRMWDHSFDSLCRLENRLYELEVTKQNAAKLWGPSTFMFLSVLGIKNSIGRTAPDDVETPTATTLAQDYLSMLFSDRDQGEDYSPPASARYEYSVFPSIAIDLERAFDIHPHFEVTAIVLTVFAHLHAMNKATSLHFSQMQWLSFRDIAGDNLIEAIHDREHLRHIWQRYLDDGRDGLTWSSIEESLDDLSQLNWDVHPGVKDVSEIMKAKSTGKTTDELAKHLCDRLDLLRRSNWGGASVDRLSDTCPNSHCRSHGRVDPTKRQWLSNLRPVICDACGWLLVPERIVEACKRVNSGKAS